MGAGRYRKPVADVARRSCACSWRGRHDAARRPVLGTDVRRINRLRLLCNRGFELLLWLSLHDENDYKSLTGYTPYSHRAVTGARESWKVRRGSSHLAGTCGFTLDNRFCDP